MDKVWEESKRQLAILAINYAPLPYKGSRDSLINLVQKIMDSSLSIEVRKECLRQAAERLYEKPEALQKKLGVSLM